MKKFIFLLYMTSAIWSALAVGSGPSDKDIAEKKQLEAKVAELEKQSLKAMIVENTKTALEEQMKQELPAKCVVRCLSVTLRENKKENEWLAEAEILCLMPECQPAFEEVTDIRISYDPENKSVNVDLSDGKLKLTAEETESICRSNLKYIGLILSMYAEEHNGQFPGDTKKAEELFKSEAANNRLCPADGKPYTYIPGLCNGDKADLPLVYCKHHQQNSDFLLLHIDGSVDYGKLLEAKELEEQQSAYDSMICRKAQKAMTRWLACLTWSDAPTCTSITNMKKISKTKWIAIATASNGKLGKINISIISFDDDDDPVVMVWPDKLSDFHNPFE